jgi:hypothetical protein
MKNFKNYLFVVLASIALTSCVEDDVVSDANVNSPSLVGFTSSAMSANAVASGAVVDFIAPVKVTGPTSSTLQGDLTITYAVNTAESTAIAGVNFNLPTLTVTVPQSTNYFANIPVQILTEGIDPPLDVSPVLVLDIVSVTGANGVAVNGRTGKVKITINYLCYSNLEGDYIINYTSGPKIHTVTQIGDGLYEMSSMFGWPTSGYIVKFTDVCGNLTLLNEWNFSNNIGGTGVVQDNGDLLWTGVFVDAVYSDRTYRMIKQ